MSLPRNLLTIAFCCLLGATGCNLVYKQNVQQGNAIEQDKLDQLRPGMTMNQVAFLLGTPAIRDPFHHDRWDYLYSYARRGGDATIRKVTLVFENAVLKEMTGTDPDDYSLTFTIDDEVDVSEVPPPDRAPVDVEPEVTAIPQPVELEPTQEPVADLPGTQPALVPEPELVSEPEPEADGAEALPEPQHADVRPAQMEPEQWLIQLGAFDELQNARNLVQSLNNAGFKMGIYSQEVGSLGTRYLVRSEGFAAKADAERQLQQIEQAFDLDGFLVPPAR
ncbi:MAG: outer membrane protein assembly factor BamE [Xanthomonadales bacterium]|nr:outer membrane protein assembly factor BamE [Xanthomonadales bacterium]